MAAQAAAGCTSCHNFGAGGGSVGADLSHGSPMFGTDQAGIQAWLAGGANKKTGIMPDYTSLGKTQIAQIAQVVASLKSGSVVPLQQ